MKAKKVKPKKNPQRPKRKKKRELKTWEIKQKPGPEKIEVDISRVRELARFMYAEDEIAVALGMSWSTFKTRKSEKPEIQIAIDEGKANGRRSLRSKQLETAMGGNVAMLIWLGKQYLEQNDKTQLGSDPKFPVVFTFTPDVTKPDNAND